MNLGRYAGLMEEISPDPEGHHAPEVCARAGISYRQLDYWISTGLVAPSIREGAGSGTQRLFSDADVEEIQTIATLLRMGMSLPSIRRLSPDKRAHLAVTLAEVLG